MATTTNYSWTTPDDTDLVKDGAAAIRSLGSAIDSTVFTNAGNAINKSIVDAKGDLIAATAADTVTRLASSGVNNDVLTVDTSTATGLKWAAPAAGGMTLLSTTTVSGTTTSITSINQTYKNLYIEIEDLNAASNYLPSFRINGSSTLHYYSRQRSSATASTIGQNVALFVYDNDYEENTDNFFRLTIFNYASTTTIKSFNFSAGWSDLGSTLTGVNGGGMFNSTSAISSFDVIGNISLTGGTVRIYGVK
jgi:hypothetical protein